MAWRWMCRATSMSRTWETTGCKSWLRAGSRSGSAATRAALDGQGNLYVVEQDNHRVQKLAPTGEPLAQWGTRGSGPAQFDNPYRVALDGQGNIYVVDIGNDRVQKLAPTGEPLAQFTW